MMKKITFLVLAIAIFFNSYAIDTLNVNITSDTTLTADTIYVPHGIVVDTGITLTINPGVMLLFNGDTTYYVTNNTQAGYFLVYGSIIAEGEADNRIVFSKNDSLNWGGIFLTDTADYSSFKFCDFSYGNRIDSIDTNGTAFSAVLHILNDSSSVYGCQFSYNPTAIYAKNTNIELFNNIFDHNVDGIKSDSTFMFIGSSTFADNNTAIFLYNNAAAVITNSIIYNNTNQLDGTGQYTVTYSNIEGYYAGTGNYAIDPQFANNINYKLSPCSGLINKGDQLATNILDTVDFFGNTRIYYLVTDMGAYEHQYSYSYTSTDTIVYNICEGDSILLDGTYFSNDTTYSNSLTGVNYCDSTYINSVRVSPNPQIIFDPNDTSVCQGSYIPVYTTIGEGFDNATYEWASSDTAESLIPLGTTGVLAVMDKQKTYYLTVTTETGCVVNDSTNIILYPEITLDLGADTTVCRQYIISAGAGYTEYKWNNFETTESIEALDSRVYSVTVTDVYGCTANDDIDITLLSSPVVKFSEDTMKMTTDDTRILGGAGLNYPDGYLWNTGATTQSITIIGMDLGIGTYTYWQYAEFSTTGCSASDTIIVVVTDGVGISEIDGLNNINLYPNPSNGLLNLNANFDEIGEISIKITNLMGKVIYSKDINNSNVVNEQIDIRNNDKGFYFVNLIYNNKTVTYKISIQ